MARQNLFLGAFFVHYSLSTLVILLFRYPHLLKGALWVVGGRGKGEGTSVGLESCVSYQRGQNRASNPGTETSLHNTRILNQLHTNAL